MAIVLSLQGGMAAGKTTAARYIQEQASYIHVGYEDNAEVIWQTKAQGLNKNVFDDYVSIQRLFIQNEIERYQKAQIHDLTLLDLGAEEIEFYTLHYPNTIGADWPVEEALRDELAALRRCLPDRILFLDAGEETLRQHKAADSGRSRGFFDFYFQFLLPLKKRWFIGKDNVDVLRIDNFTAAEVGAHVKAWVDGIIGLERRR